MKRKLKAEFGQGGQSLAEFVLALPVLMMFLFGILQIGILGVVMLFGHYATNCALRSYTVFYAQGKSLAIERAGRAMEQAFAWCHPMPDLELTINEDKPDSGVLADAEYTGDKPVMFRARISAQVPLLIAMRGIKNLELNFESSMLSEYTVDAQK